ncbi:PilN domain-containing protein [Rhodopirellula sp. ICT_H3.1]|uniref:PilN domain-containing protein n=2 Tax=Aporhodopirellula aestuarii TaxID=2950107 RepID=A0ABT0U9Z3_9BACT|nr:PilN domain-containing protein [Aporhodopirellula aestuarii]
MPWRFQLYLIVRDSVIRWLVVCGVIVLVAPIYWHFQKDRLSASADALALLESRCAPVRAFESENSRMAQRVKELRARQTLLARLDDQQVPFRLMGLISQSSKHSGGGVQLKNVSIERVHEKTVPTATVTSAKGEPAKPVHQEVTRLRLNGTAQGNIAISRFVAALRDTSVFTKVELKSSVGARKDDSRTQTFLVECIMYPHTFHSEHVQLDITHRSHHVIR